MECQSIRGLTTLLPWNFCGWTCFILESYLIYKICICRINDPDGVYKYFLKVVWIFLVGFQFTERRTNNWLLCKWVSWCHCMERTKEKWYLTYCALLLTSTCSTLLAIVDLSVLSLVKLVWNHFKGLCCLILSPFFVMHKITFN